jgi:hypothetical protein
LYDATPAGSRRVLRATVPGVGSCAGTPCWKARGNSGFSYRDREHGRDGVASLTVKISGNGQASIALKAKGPSLPTPALPLSHHSAAWRRRVLGDGPAGARGPQ